MPDPHLNSPDPPPTDLDRAMIRRAIALAEAAARDGEVPVAAIIYNLETGNILAEAANRRETDQDPTAHAEIIALQAAAQKINSWRLIDHAIAVTLEPCPMCAGALVNARIDRLVYGAADPMMGCARTLHQLCDEPRFNHRMTIVPGVDAEACGTLLKKFFEARRREKKHPPSHP